MINKEIQTTVYSGHRKINTGDWITFKDLQNGKIEIGMYSAKFTGFVEINKHELFAALEITND